MKYNKPQIINTQPASKVIMSSQQKDPNIQADVSLTAGTNPGYSADE